MGAFWLPFGSLWAPWGSPWAPKVAFGTLFGRPFFPCRVLMDLGCLPGPQTKERRYGDSPSGHVVKHHILSQSSEILMGKRYFAKVGFPRPSGKGDY